MGFSYSKEFGDKYYFKLACSFDNFDKHCCSCFLVIRWAFGRVSHEKFMERRDVPSVNLTAGHLGQLDQGHGICT